MKIENIFSEQLNIFEISYLYKNGKYSFSDFIAFLINMAEKKLIVFEKIKSNSIFKLNNFELIVLDNLKIIHPIEEIIITKIKEKNQTVLSDIIYSLWIEDLLKIDKIILDSLKEKGFIIKKRFLLGLILTDRGKKLKNEIKNFKKTMNREIKNSYGSNIFYDFLPIAFSLNIVNLLIKETEKYQGKDYFLTNQPFWYKSELENFNPRKFNTELINIIVYLSQQNTRGIKH